MFHVPEQYRIQVRNASQSTPGELWGYFMVPHTNGRAFLCMACDGMQDPNDPIPEIAVGWEHVSVSINKRGGTLKSKLPSWTEMCLIKSLFWGPEDVVVQYHPAESKYVDYKEVLHLWRYTLAPFPTPDVRLV